MIFFLPEAEWRYRSDSLPFHAAPLYREIQTVPTFCAYRIHRSSLSGGLNGSSVAAACQMLKRVPETLWLSCTSFRKGKTLSANTSPRSPPLPQGACVISPALIEPEFLSIARQAMTPRSPHLSVEEISIRRTLSRVRCLPEVAPFIMDGFYTMRGQIGRRFKDAPTFWFFDG